MMEKESLWEWKKGAGEVRTCRKQRRGGEWDGLWRGRGSYFFLSVTYVNVCLWKWSHDGDVMRLRPRRGSQGWLADKTLTHPPFIRVADSLTFAEGQVPPELKRQHTRSSSVHSAAPLRICQFYRVLQPFASCWCCFLKLFKSTSILFKSYFLWSSSSWELQCLACSLATDRQNHLNFGYKASGLKSPSIFALGGLDLCPSFQTCISTCVWPKNSVSLHQSDASFLTWL